MDIIPENIRSKIDPADLAKLPKEVRSSFTEQQGKKAKELERAIHSQFAGWLRTHKRLFSFNHADPTRASRMRTGWPDFSIHRNNRSLLIEFKVPPNKLTADQIEVFQELSDNGNEVTICTTLGDAIHLTFEYFGITGEDLAK